MWTGVIGKKADRLVSHHSLCVVRGKSVSFRIGADSDAEEPEVWGRLEQKPSSGIASQNNDLRRVKRELAELRARLQYVCMGAQPRVANPRLSRRVGGRSWATASSVANMVTRLQNFKLIPAEMGGRVCRSCNTPLCNQEDYQIVLT